MHKWNGWMGHTSVGQTSMDPLDLLGISTARITFGTACLSVMFVLVKT